MLWLLSILQIPAALPGNSALFAMISVALVALALLAARRTVRPAPAPHLGLRVVSVRKRAMRAAFLRQRDPDAAGRPRPRAPSVDPAA
jgi:hypothetical protein